MVQEIPITDLVSEEPSEIPPEISEKPAEPLENSSETPAEPPLEPEGPVVVPKPKRRGRPPKDPNAPPKPPARPKKVKPAPPPSPQASQAPTAPPPNVANGLHDNVATAPQPSAYDLLVNDWKTRQQLQRQAKQEMYSRFIQQMFR